MRAWWDLGCSIPMWGLGALGNCAHQHQGLCNPTLLAKWQPLPTAATSCSPSPEAQVNTEHSFCPKMGSPPPLWL